MHLALTCRLYADILLTCSFICSPVHETLPVKFSNNSTTINYWRIKLLGVFLNAYTAASVVVTSWDLCSWIYLPLVTVYTSIVVRYCVPKYHIAIVLIEKLKWHRDHRYGHLCVGMDTTSFIGSSLHNNMWFSLTSLQRITHCTWHCTLAVVLCACAHTCTYIHIMARMV
jgi:hypothetical protein